MARLKVDERPRVQPQSTLGRLWRARLRCNGPRKREHAERGLTVIRIYIDPERFPAWCAKRGLVLDAKARIAFATEGAMDRRAHSSA